MTIANTRFIVAPMCLKSLLSALNHEESIGGQVASRQYWEAVRRRRFVRSFAM